MVHNDRWVHQIEANADMWYEPVLEFPILQKDYNDGLLISKSAHVWLYCPWLKKHCKFNFNIKCIH